MSSDGRHFGYAVLVDVFGTVVDVDMPLAAAGTRSDLESLSVRAVCESCGWHVDEVDTRRTHPLVLTADGSVDVAASEVAPRRDWELHSGEGVLRALAALRSLPLDERLAALHNAELAMAAEIERGVHAARIERMGWVEIGSAFGVTRQAATKRWKKLEPNKEGDTS